jgi:hypothetical protein
VRTANGTALCHYVQLYRYFVSQSGEFCRHKPLCSFSTSIYCYCCLFRYRLSPETFGYTLVCYTISSTSLNSSRIVNNVNVGGGGGVMIWFKALERPQKDFCLDNRQSGRHWNRVHPNKSVNRLLTSAPRCSSNKSESSYLATSRVVEVCASLLYERVPNAYCATLHCRGRHYSSLYLVTYR